MQIFNHHQLLMSLDCHGNGADLIRCCNISRQPTSLGKMALTVRGALHTYIYAKSFLSGPCPIPPDKLCPTAIRPCWPGAGFAIRALTKDIGEGVCASIVPGVQAHFIHHEPICTTRPMQLFGDSGSRSENQKHVCDPGVENCFWEPT